MYKFINERIISDLNNFLSNGQFSNETYEIIKEGTIKEKKPSDEVLFGKIIEAFPGIERDESKELRKFINFDACQVHDFRIGRFNPKKLNDPHETKWFSTFLDRIGSTKYSDAVKNLIRRNDLFVSYTTRTTKNEHYMYSNYSPTSQNHLRYDYDNVLRKFKALPSTGNICGYVRYGQNKVEVMKLAKELGDKHGSRPGIKFALTIMCFFVKSVCAKPEKEFRFMSISNDIEISDDYLSLSELPSYGKLEENSDDLIHNHFYLNTNKILNTECGCHEKGGSKEGESNMKNCEVNHTQD